MQIIEIIRTASTNSEILSALSVYAHNLRDIASLPDGFLRPLHGAADVRERMLALMAVVNLTSQHFRYDECNAAKRALRVFAEALARLDPRARPGG